MLTSKFRFDFLFFFLLYDTLIFNAPIIFFFEWYSLFLILLLHTNDDKKKNIDTAAISKASTLNSKDTRFFKDSFRYPKHSVSFLKKEKKTKIFNEKWNHFGGRSLSSLSGLLGKNNPCSNSSLPWKRTIYISKPRNDTKLARRRSHSARDPDFRVAE